MKTFLVLSEKREVMLNAENALEAASYAFAKHDFQSAAYVVYDWDLNRSVVTLEEVTRSTDSV